MKKRAAEIRRFSFWGLINTLIGILLIYILQTLTGNAYAANLAGFALGGLVSYWVHATFTFKARKTAGRAGVFFLIMVVCYTLNLLALSLLLPIMSDYLAQLIAIAIYIVFSYTLQSRHAFPQSSRLE